MTGLKETQVTSSPNATFTGEESKAQRGKRPVQVTQQMRGQAKDRGTLLLGSTTHTKSQSSTNQPQTTEVKSHSAHTLAEPFRVTNTPQHALPQEGVVKKRILSEQFISKV